MFSASKTLLGGACEAFQTDWRRLQRVSQTPFECPIPTLTGGRSRRIGFCLIRLWPDLFLAWLVRLAWSVLRCLFSVFGGFLERVRAFQGVLMRSLRWRFNHFTRFAPAGNALVAF